MDDVVKRHSLHYVHFGPRSIRWVKLHTLSLDTLIYKDKYVSYEFTETRKPFISRINNMKVCFV